MNSGRHIGLMMLLCGGALWLSSGCRFGWDPLFDEKVDEATFEAVTIAPLAQALTFARTREGTVIAVTRYHDNRVSGVDLAAALGEAVKDPVTLFNARGYDELQRLIRDAPAATRRELAVAELGIPVDLTAHHIAAGTNYPEHAAEAGVEDGPYLFPKLVKPTVFDATVPAHKALLDYEVELAFVTLKPLQKGQMPAFMGLLLCNDFTDRETLLRHIDTSDVASGAGFTTGKSFPGYLPVGNLFVIPKDYRSFARDTELRLYVHSVFPKLEPGEFALRQRSLASRAVWDIDQMVDETWAREETRWHHRGEQVSLFSTPGSIAPRTLLMTGTPPGVVFNAVTVGQRAGGFFDWLAFGWGDSIPDHALENYITEARAAGIFLHPDDEVVIHVAGLGVLRNKVIR